MDKVLGDRILVTYQDTVDLKYCSAIFKESLRLYPPAGSIDRQATEEMEINGIKIPSDTHIIVNEFYFTGLIKSIK